jgi:hypothetical protein
MVPTNMILMPNFCEYVYCNLSGISAPQMGRDVYRRQQLNELDINRVHCTFLNEIRKKCIIRMRKESYIHLWKCSYLECCIVFKSHSVSSFFESSAPAALRIICDGYGVVQLAAAQPHSHHGKRRGCREREGQGWIGAYVL